VVGFVSLPDEHAPSVKYRVRRVLHAQRTDPIKPPRSAPPAGVDLQLLPYRVEMAVDFRFGLDFALSVAIRGLTTTQ